MSTKSALAASSAIHSLLASALGGAQRGGTAVLPPSEFPERVDYEGARQVIGRLYPVTLRQVQRMLAELPRVYVGKSPLFETAAVARLARERLNAAPTIAGNPPPPRPRKRQAAG